MVSLRNVGVKQHSGFVVQSYKLIPPLRNGFFQFRKNNIGGDAPKDFIRVYEYGQGTKRNWRTWPSYIAKVGHKSYPTESITEHLITRLGQSLGFRMAESRLMRINGQVRFCSKYFLKRDERLVHGAEVFAAYLEDLEFVNEVEDKRLSPGFFHFQFVCDSIKAIFPNEHEAILEDFVRMVAFDAIVGNNDRHHYNWGVVTDIRGTRPAKFSPIFDSARALFWNLTEAKLKNCVCHPKTGLIHPAKRDSYLATYAKRTKPWTGWDKTERVGHFELIANILEHYPQYRGVLLKHCSQNALTRIEDILHSEFHGLIGAVRRALIFDCLALRLKSYTYLVEGGHHDTMAI